MNIRDIIVLLFRVLLGATFIFSGLAKLASLYQFEQIIFKTDLLGWNLIPYASRLLIALEIFLGICFFYTKGLKKFTVPITTGLLVLFCIHLTYVLITEGKGDNCGCFGELLPMNNLDSLIKNLVMLAMLFYLWRVPIEEKAFFVFMGSSGVLALVLVLAFFPIKEYGEFKEEVITTEKAKKFAHEAEDSLKTPEQIKAEAEMQMKLAKEAELKTMEEKKKAELLAKQNKKDTAKKFHPKDISIIADPPKPERVTSKFASFKNYSNGKTTHLDEGQKIVAMYNTGCEHCMENAKKLCALNKKMMLPEVYILFWGEESEVSKFFEFAGCTYPYKILEPQVFFPLIGKDNFPKVHYLHEGNIMGEWAGDNFTPEKLVEALKK